MKKLNKKGFTLVELLAVIIILALLMVVVANTALPAMNNARKNSLAVYAQRLQEKAKEMYMSNGETGKVGYSVNTLMGSVDQYSGYVVVNYTGTDYVATVFVIDVKNSYGLYNISKVQQSDVATSQATASYASTAIAADKYSSDSVTWK